MAQTHPHPHLHVPHVNLRGDEQGSPWLLLPGVALALAVVIGLLILASFLIADAIAGRFY